MSSNESSGASAEATATTPAPSAEFPTFGTTRGSGLARGKRPSAGPAAATAAAPSDYKPTAIEVVNAPREYTNPFAPAEPVAPAPVAAPVAPVVTVAAPVVAPATPVRASSPVAADLATFSSAQVDAPAPIADEPAELNILPPAEHKATAAQTWESDGFRPTRGESRSESRNERPRREERQDEPAAASEEVDVDSIPAKFLYVRPGVKFVPTPRNWGGAPRERSERSHAAADGVASPAPVSRSEAPRASVQAPAKSGGFFGWLKSLFGGESAAAPVAVAQDSSEQSDGGERRNRGGRSRGGRGPGGGEGGGQRRHRGGRNRNRSGGEPEGSRQGGI